MNVVKVVKFKGNSEANKKSVKMLKSGLQRLVRTEEASWTKGENVFKKLKQARLPTIQRFNYHDLG